MHSSDSCSFHLFRKVCETKVSMDTWKKNKYWKSHTHNRYTYILWFVTITQSTRDFQASQQLPLRLPDPPYFAPSLQDRRLKFFTLLLYVLVDWRTANTITGKCSGPWKVCVNKLIWSRLQGARQTGNNPPGQDLVTTGKQTWHRSSLSHVSLDCHLSLGKHKLVEIIRDCICKHIVFSSVWGGWVW